MHAPVRLTGPAPLRVLRGRQRMKDGTSTGSRLDPPARRGAGPEVVDDRPRGLPAPRVPAETPLVARRGAALPGGRRASYALTSLPVEPFDLRRHPLPVTGRRGVRADDAVAPPRSSSCSARPSPARCSTPPRRPDRGRRRGLRRRAGAYLGRPTTRPTTCRPTRLDGDAERRGMALDCAPCPGRPARRSGRRADRERPRGDSSVRVTGSARPTCPGHDGAAAAACARPGSRSPARRRLERGLPATPRAAASRAPAPARRPARRASTPRRTTTAKRIAAPTASASPATCSRRLARQEGRDRAAVKRTRRRRRRSGVRRWHPPAPPGASTVLTTRGTRPR